MRLDDIAQLGPLERKALLEEVAAMVLSGALQLGDAVRFLRSAVFGMDRERFAQIVRISPRALATLEDDADANPTLETLRKVFAPFGGSVSLVFAHMEEPAPLDDARQDLRSQILEALERNRRRPRSARSR